MNDACTLVPNDLILPLLHHLNSSIQFTYEIENDEVFLDIKVMVHSSRLCTRNPHSRTGI